MSTLQELKYFACPPFPPFFLWMAPPFKPFFLGDPPEIPPAPPYLVKNERSLTARSAQQDQEDNKRQGVLCSRADPVERSFRRVESFGQSQNFYGTVKNSLF